MNSTTTTSGNKERYTSNIQNKNQVKKKSNIQDDQTQRKKVLVGRNKRNVWLDYPDEEFLPEYNKQGLADQTEFKIQFPQHRENYFKSNLVKIKAALSKVFVDFALDFKKGEAIVTTTNKTYDPFIIVKCKLLVKCMARGVVLEKAVDLLKNNTFCDIIHIKQLCKNQKIFKKRRGRLFGPNGSTLKAIEILTNSYIVIMGGTVTCIGSVEACREVRKITEDCMFNIHPIYRIKELMIINQYKKDDEMKNKNWNDYLPKFKKVNKTRKKKPVLKRKKTYSTESKHVDGLGIPIARERKEDKQMETGEYFIMEKERMKKRKQEQSKGEIKEKKQKKSKTKVIDNILNKKKDTSDKFNEGFFNNLKKNEKKRKRSTIRNASSLIDTRKRKRVKRK